jgi:hypothetical protein
MKLPFHLIIEYAHQNKPGWVKEAYDKFFAPTGYPKEEEDRDAFPLFSEWLIYDYPTQNKSILLVEYYLKNPDKLDQSILVQFEQIIKTHWYGGFQLGRRKKGEWLEGEHLFSGKKIIIYDHHGSINLPMEGMIIGRVAKVDDKWCLIGSNPIYLPMTYTSRMKKIMRTNKSPYVSPQDTWQLLLKHREKTPTPSSVTDEDILKKRKELEINYQQITKDAINCMSFKQLVKLIYEEDGRPPLDVWEQITKAGLPNKIFVKHIELFNDIWNYFPHKILNNNCPVGLFNKFNKE